MSKEKWEMRYFCYATASLLLPRLRSPSLHIVAYNPTTTSLGSRGFSTSAGAGRGDVTGLAARVTGLALLLRAFPRDVTVLTTVLGREVRFIFSARRKKNTHVALSGATEATTETARSTRGALPGNVANTTAGLKHACSARAYSG